VILLVILVMDQTMMIVKLVTQQENQFKFKVEWNVIVHLVNLVIPMVHVLLVLYNVKNVLLLICVLYVVIIEKEIHVNLKITVMKIMHRMPNVVTILVMSVMELQIMIVYLVNQKIIENQVVLPVHVRINTLIMVSLNVLNVIKLVKHVLEN